MSELPATRPPLHVVPSRLPPPRRSILAAVVHALLDWASQKDGPSPQRLPEPAYGAQWDARVGCYVIGEDHLCNACQRPMRTERCGWRCVPCGHWLADPAVQQAVPLNLPAGHTGNPDFF